MSYFNWANYNFNQNLFGSVQQQPEQQFTFSSYNLPARPAPTWYDAITGRTMYLVGSSPYYDVVSSKTNENYTWQGTRVDVYKTPITSTSPYYSTPYTNPILPSYDNQMNTPPYVLPISREIYMSTMSYDKTLGRYVQQDELIDTRTMKPEVRTKLGAPDTISQSEIASKIMRRDYYSGGYF